MTIHICGATSNRLITAYSSDPATGKDGDVIVNTTTNELKIWYNGTWNLIGITITSGVPPTPPDYAGVPIGIGLAITYPE